MPTVDLLAGQSSMGRGDEDPALRPDQGNPWRLVPTLAQSLIGPSSCGGRRGCRSARCGCARIGIPFGPKPLQSEYTEIMELAERIGGSRRATTAYFFYVVLDTTFRGMIARWARKSGGRTTRCTRRRPHYGFSCLYVSPAAAAGELFRSANQTWQRISFP